jgi:tetratricopeptide (TPR) repeat protein
LIVDFITTLGRKVVYLVLKTGRYDKGVDLDDLNKPEEPIKAYDKAIEINPQDSLFWYGKGEILVKFGKSDEA